MPVQIDDDSQAIIDGFADVLGITPDMCANRLESLRKDNRLPANVQTATTATIQEIFHTFFRGGGGDVPLENQRGQRPRAFVAEVQAELARRRREPGPPGEPPTPGVVRSMIATVKGWFTGFRHRAPRPVTE